ncbi:MAG: hypothetical protein KAW89_06530 [Armatimonadetes bacterium]|nr:hypothetical protein [Armatimonadota bacterium]
MMNSRQRMTALLNREIPDRMGLFEHFWGETIPQYWVNEGYPEGENPHDFFGLDLRGAGGWLDTAPFPGTSELLEETDQWQVARDGRGAILKNWKNKSGTPQHIDFTVKSPKEWAEYRAPLLELDRHRYDAEATRQALQEIRSQSKFSTYGNLAFVELLRGTLGDLVWLPALLIEKEWIHDFNSVYLEFFQTHYAQLFEAAGLPDGMFIYEDLGFSNGLWCSPQVMREMFLPYYKALVDFFKSYGLPVILHTCGDIRKAVPMIIEAGFDCLQPMEAKAGNDVVEFANEYGDELSYMGNIDVTVLNTNDRQRVREEIVRKLEAMRQMRIPYIFHSDHSIPPDVRYDTYCYALELLREYGDY